MSREIKFRGKSLIDGRWIYGDLFRTDLDGGVAIQYYDEVDGWMTENVNPNTVCQFTGLKDSNGKEIYEGDIIRRIARISFYGNNKASAHVVKFGEDGIYNGFYLEPQCDAFFVSHNSFIFEVIGNIHDNPELMEGGEK